MTQILTKEFSLAEVLGTISGYLLVDKGFDRIHELIEWVAGGAVFSHQIPSVAPYCVKGLVRQFPQLDTEKHELLAQRVELIVRAIKNKETAAESLMWAGLKEQYGDSFQVAPLQPFDEFEAPPLITDNIRDKVIIVETQGDDFPDHVEA